VYVQLDNDLLVDSDLGLKYLKTMFLTPLSCQMLSFFLVFIGDSFIHIIVHVFMQVVGVI